MLFAVLFQASQLQRESPLLSFQTSPSVNPVEPAYKSATKRSSSRVSRVDIEISSSSFLKAVAALLTHYPDSTAV